ncbi:MAG TPA: outer membrane beta-barrel protein [Polyangiaceae bacterium]|nr:outer membrane beta-barrel protein [Polyangiaceae bacterium]
MKSRTLLTSALFGLTILSLCETAAAQESGFEAGLRTGYGVPFGEGAEDAQDISDAISGIIPLWIDVGYRVTPNVFVGAYFQYGLGFEGEDIEDACDLDGIDCSVSSHRLGAQLHYHFSPRRSADPWLGLGFGYEWYNAHVEAGDGELSASISGFEFANLQGGVDFYPGEHFYLGPFVSFSLDQYDSLDVECSGAGNEFCDGFGDGDIEDKSIHNWFVVGIRGGYTGFGR